MRKGCDRNPEITILPAVFGDRTSFRAKGLRREPGNRNFTCSFWRSNFISCERVRRTRCNLQFYLQFLAIEPHFVRRGCAGRVATRNFTCSFWRSNVISCERVAFRAVSFALPRAFKREIEKKERARGQESKRARGQEGKRAGGHESKRARCEDVKM